MANRQWSRLSRSELIAFGKRIVTERLDALGCVVSTVSNPMDGRLDVQTASGRRLEVYVSTQRVGGYAFWTKRRLQLASHRFAAIVLLGDEPEPQLYLVPATEWDNASPPLTDRDYDGKASAPEYGVALGPASLDSLRRYAWDARADARHIV